ncbi:XrtA system polysaccharide chain length determinant [Pelagibius sp.]|uniref:XrtA system polysaccharide chain length determinant n=1 Tax=Pelagibius sp. TaxID=1931238 RepID=UPI00260DD469|nr:XrtA system polysaccharide chain length determinant [Pelagibius sp.]
MTELYTLVFFYLNALWKRRWVVVVGAWIVAVPGWLLVASLPSVYESSSRIYVDTSSVLQPLLRGIAVQSNLQTQVQMMKQTLLSRPNLMEVARETDYDLTVTNDIEMEQLLESIESRTSVSSNREDIFAISFEDPDPQRAYDVVQALLSIFVESNLGESREDLDTAEEFIDRQIADYEARLIEAEDRLAKFKQSNIDVVLGEGSYLGRATAATDRMEQLEQDLSVAVAQRNLLREELSAIPETVATELVNAGPPDDTEYRIVEIEAQLRLLLSQYTEKHPDVVTLKRQLGALEAKREANLAALAEAGETASDAEEEGFGAPNPIYGQVKLQLIQIETAIEDLRRRAATARAEAEALVAKAEDVPRVEAEYKRLNRDYDIIKARHDELLSRRESARMSRSRDAVGQQVQYRLIDPPVVANQPVGPNRPLFLAAVLILSLGAGLGLGFLLVILDTSFSTAAELRDFTGIPVFGTVSDTRKKAASQFAGNLALGSIFLALVVSLGVLLVIERQYGLDTFVTADLSTELFGRGARLVVDTAYDLLDWMRANVLS